MSVTGDGNKTDTLGPDTAETRRTCVGYVPLKTKITFSVICLVFGAVLGSLSKILDMTAVNELPHIFQVLDFTNFLGRFAIWIFLAVCIALLSSSPERAALNAFLFFLGMVGCYYLVSALAAGFFPKRYAMIWFAITVLSPLPACLCWYAKKDGWFGAVISGVIVGALLSQAILMFQGIRIAHVPELILWLVSMVILRRKAKEFAVMIVISLFTAALIQLVLPYWG